MLKDLKINCDIVDILSEVHCEVFEDNQSCIAVAESKKLPARTEYIVMKYHHFRSLVDNKTITSRHINTNK